MKWDSLYILIRTYFNSITADFECLEIGFGELGLIVNVNSLFKFMDLLCMKTEGKSMVNLVISHKHTHLKSEWGIFRTVTSTRKTCTVGLCRIVLLSLWQIYWKASNQDRRRLLNLHDKHKCLKWIKKLNIEVNCLVNPSIMHCECPCHA